MNKKIYLVLTLLSLLSSTTFAQTLLDAHFNGFGFLDDHEYDALIPLRKTISGTRTQVDLGLHLDSLNHFIVGINALHEFGGKPYFLTADPVAYYQFDNKHWQFDAGQFPREGLLTQYPRALLNDTLIYYRPNIQGLLLRFQSSHGYETGWIDWVSRQTTTNRNQFLAGEFGKFIPVPGGVFYLSHFFMFMHDAGSKSLDAAPIEDNGGAQIRLGFDLSKKQSLLDSLSFEIGGMGSAHRVRSVYSFQTSKGFVASAFASYKWFSLYDEFYKGDPNDIVYGDPFYVKPIYNRLDVSFTPFVYRGLKGQFTFSFHQSPGHPGDMSEIFKVVYDIGRIKIATLKRYN